MLDPVKPEKAEDREAIDDSLLPYQAVDMGYTVCALKSDPSCTKLFLAIKICAFLLTRDADDFPQTPACRFLWTFTS